MPDVSPGESYNDFMNKCIPIVKKEDTGKGYDKDHAVAKCHGIWETAKKRTRIRRSL